MEGRAPCPSLAERSRKRLCRAGTPGSPLAPSALPLWSCWLLTVSRSEARLGSALRIFPCTDLPNPKRIPPRSVTRPGGSRHYWPANRPPHHQLRPHQLAQPVHPTWLAPLAIDPTARTGLKKMSWTRPCSCWWSGRSTSQGQREPHWLCRKGKRWFAAPARVHRRRRWGRGCRFVPD